MNDKLIMDFIIMDFEDRDPTCLSTSSLNSLTITYSDSSHHKNKKQIFFPDDLVINLRYNILCTLEIFNHKSDIL